MRRDGLLLFAAVVASVAFVIVLGLGLSFVPNLLSAASPTPTTGGIEVNKKQPARDFTLTNQDGKPMKLSDFRGKAVMIFFGYTHCPDVCPLEMADFKRIKDTLQQTSPGLSDRVSFVMISVDGQRDTPDVMKKYVETFDPGFIGLTGDPNQVADIGLDYGVKVEFQKPSGTQASYLIAHTSFTYLLDPKGVWRIAYPFQTPTNQVASDIQRVLSN